MLPVESDAARNERHYGQGVCQPVEQRCNFSFFSASELEDISLFRKNRTKILGALEVGIGRSATLFDFSDSERNRSHERQCQYVVHGQPWLLNVVGYGEDSQGRCTGRNRLFFGIPNVVEGTPLAFGFAGCLGNLIGAFVRMRLEMV